MPRPASDQPTDGELEILNILWEQGPCELGELHAVLSEQRTVALTTVATMLNVMLGKRLVSREKSGRRYRWSAELSRGHAAQGMVRKLLDHLFDGSAQQLVTHLLQDQKLSASERREILRILEAGRKSAESRGGKKS